MCRYCLEFKDPHDQLTAFDMHEEASKLNKAIRSFESKLLEFEKTLAHKPKEKREVNALHKATVRCRKQFNTFYNEKFLLGFFDHRESKWR